MASTREIVTITQDDEPNEVDPEELLYVLNINAGITGGNYYMEQRFAYNISEHRGDELCYPHMIVVTEGDTAWYGTPGFGVCHGKVHRGLQHWQ